MPKSTYYDMATTIMCTYMQAQPDKRIDLVRECIGSNDELAEIHKVYKALDSLLIKLESLRGAMASQLALGWCTLASEAQMSLFTHPQDPKPLLFDDDHE
jgi:hypothetical protein